jgi:general secretion pathway protein F
MLSGEIAATSRESALETLVKRNEIPIDLVECERVARPWWQRELSAPRPLPTAALAAFTRELSSLVAARLPLDETLRVIELQPMLPRRTRLLTERLARHLSEGQSLSEALRVSGGAFPRAYTRLVAAGEASGTLDQVLSGLATDLERSAVLREKALSQLLYPAILIVAALCAVVLIVTILVPAILPIFEDARAEPPSLLALLAAFGDLISRHGGLIGILLAAIVTAAVFARSSSAVHQRVDQIVLALPIIGTIVRESDSARLARTLSALLANGVSAPEAIDITGETLTNSALAQTLTEARSAVEQGSTLTAPLAASNLFPELLIRLMRIGEETGQLPDMLARVADAYQTSVAQRLERVSNLITPVLTIGIGIFVGALVISVMSAILSVNELVLR